MFSWWFGSRPGPREYGWWHPIDHGASSWDGGTPGEAVGSTHIVTEKLTGLPDQDLLIEFHDPTEFFTASAYSAARESGTVSTAITGHVGFGHDAPRRKDGSVLAGVCCTSGGTPNGDWSCAATSCSATTFRKPA
jgi:hypothetical protein